MSAASPRDRVRAVYEGFARGDIGPFVEVVDADIVWVEPEGVDHAGTYRGRDTVLRDVLPRNTDWENHRVMPDELVGEGPTVVVLGHYAGVFKATGKEMRAGFAHIWRFGDRGTVTRFEAVIDTGQIHKAMAR